MNAYILFHGRGYVKRDMRLLRKGRASNAPNETKKVGEIDQLFRLYPGHNFSCCYWLGSYLGS